MSTILRCDGCGTEMREDAVTDRFHTEYTGNRWWEDTHDWCSPCMKIVRAAVERFAGGKAMQVELPPLAAQQLARGGGVYDITQGPLRVSIVTPPRIQVVETTGEAA